MQAGNDSLVNNIGREGVDQRLCRTVYAFSLTLGIVVALRLLVAPAWAFALVFLPFAGSFWLAYQAMWKTCTILATRGMRDVGDGHEVIANPAEACELRARGRRIVRYVLASATVATALVVAATAL